MFFTKKRGFIIAAILTLAMSVLFAAPTVSITSPKDGDVIDEVKSITVSGTADNATMVGVKLNDGKYVKASLSGNAWTISIGVTKGKHVISVMAMDSAKAVTEVKISITIGKEVVQALPTVKITAPADGSTIDAKSITISGTAENATMVGVKVDNGKILKAALSGDTWTASIGLEVGSHVITAIALNDQKKESAPVSITISRPAPAPAIAITTKGGATYDASVTISGTVAGEDVTAVTVNGVKAAVKGTAFTAVVGVNDGDNTITATVENKYGAKASTSIVISKSTPPAVGIVTKGGSTEGDSTEVQGVASGTSVGYVMVKIGKAAPVKVAVKDGKWSVNVPLSVGANNVEAVAVSDAGATSKPATLDINRNLPLSVSITTPKEGNLGDVKSITVSGVATGATKVGVQIDNGKFLPAALTGDNFSTSIGLSDGDHTITVMAIDGGGKTVTASVKITRTIPLEVELSAKVLGLIDIDLNGKVVGEVKTVTITIDGKAVTTGTFDPKTNTWRISASLAPGKHTIEVTATHVEGKVQKKSYDFTVNASVN